MSEFEKPDRKPTVEDVRQLMGASTPHFALQIRNRIRNLIRENKIAQMYSSIQTGQGQGMQTLDQCLTEMLAKGLVSKEEARYKAANKDTM